MQITPVLVNEDTIYRRSPDYGAQLLLGRPAIPSPPFPYFALIGTRPSPTFFEDKFVSVYSVIEPYQQAAFTPRSTYQSIWRPSIRLPEIEGEYQRFNHGVYFSLVRLYAAQLVGYTAYTPDFCDHPWLEWVHPPASPESAIFPFRQIPTFVRGQQFNLFFNQPRPWPVEGEVDTVSRLANYGIMVPWARPTIVVQMPDVLGLPVVQATALINAVGGTVVSVTYVDTIFPIPPLPQGIVLLQSPLPFVSLSPPFNAYLIASSGLMNLPAVGDSINDSPVNVVIGSTQFP